MSEEKQKSVGVKRVFSYIFEKYREIPRKILFLLMSNIFDVALKTFPAFYYKEVVEIMSNALEISSDIVANASAILLYVLWLKLIGFITGRIKDYFLITAEVDLKKNLYMEAFTYLQRHSLNFFSNNFSGSLIKKFTKFINTIEAFTDILFLEIIAFFVDVTVIFIVVGLENVRFAVFFAAMMIIFSIIQYYLYQWVFPYQKKTNAIDSELGGFLSDTITNNFNLKVFASVKREEKSFDKLTTNRANAEKGQYYRSMVIRASTLLFSILLEVGVLYFAVQLRGEGTVSIGVFVLLQSYVLRLLPYLRGIGNVLRKFNRHVTEIGEMIEILDTPHDIIDHTDKKLKVKDGRIEFNEVYFSYDGKNEVFNQLSFNIKPGERIGLVGPSGGGKTTISKLLFRFYDIQKGEILIDGQDISQVTQDSLRAQIGMVPQDPILFHRSIKENIIYGKPNATEEEMIAAAKMARCYDFIEKLPNKYDTLVGERGIKLSGGERQRVAIARAILENAPILVMDEATSALDSESEHLIQEAMEELMRNKTVIVIAHRLSTIMKMDKIMVIENGKIIEKGSHNELLLKQGEYAKLRDIQSGGFIGE